MLPMIFSVIDDPDDRAFLAGIYQQYGRLMYRTAEKYADDRQTREDIVQDAVLKLIDKLALLRGMDECAMAGFITVLVRNTALNHLRHNGVVSRHTADVEPDELTAEQLGDAPSVDELALLAERREVFQKVWLQLSERDRLLLEGKYILDDTDEELARLMGCKPSSVRMALTRARRNAVRAVLESEGSIA